MTPAEVDARAPLSGLTPDEASQTAERFFATFKWDPPKLDPRAMSAEEFLARL